MNNGEVLTLLTEKFKKENSNIEVDGITVMIDGKIQQIFEELLSYFDTGIDGICLKKIKLSFRHKLRQ